MLCVLRLRYHSYFNVTSNNAYVVEWCNQEALKRMQDQNDWDIDKRFAHFYYSHSVPMWSEGCAEEVIIETDIALRAIFD